MSNSTDKHRLWITLHDRKAENSVNELTYHFGRLLQAKTDRGRGSAKVDAFKFHIINGPEIKGGHIGPAGPWRYDSGSCDPLRSSLLLVKIVVAKLPSASSTVADWAEIINKGLSDAFDLSNNNYTCRTWVFAALERLRDEIGGDFSAITQFLPAGAGKLEVRMHVLAGKARHKWLADPLKFRVYEDFRQQPDSEA